MPCTTLKGVPGGKVSERLSVDSSLSSSHRDRKGGNSFICHLKRFMRTFFPCISRCGFVMWVWWSHRSKQGRDLCVTWQLKDHTGALMVTLLYLEASRMALHFSGMWNVTWHRKPVLRVLVRCWQKACVCKCVYGGDVNYTWRKNEQEKKEGKKES